MENVVNNLKQLQEIQEHKEFSIHSWYGTFEHITPKTVILELSETVLKWFLFEEPSEEDSGEDSDGEETPLPDEFKEKLKNAFNTLGKTVFVKNNWHAPIVRIIDIKTMVVKS